jgi:hypothetical protein
MHKFPRSGSVALIISVTYSIKCVTFTLQLFLVFACILDKLKLVHQLWYLVSIFGSMHCYNCLP